MMEEHIIQINAATCVGCGLCKRDCPAGNIAIVQKKATIVAQNCIKCGHCVAICPKAAISMTGFDEPPQEITKPTALNPQELLQAIQARRTIRQFTSQSIAPEMITQIIEGGRWTPTGENAQNVSYIVLQNDIGRYEKIAVQFFRRLLPVAKLIHPAAKNITIDEHFFFKKAPVVILVISNDKINGALAASNMELMAEANHIGVLYSGFFTIVANLCGSLHKALGLKRKEKIATTLVLGYSAVTYYRTAQKEAAKVRTL